MKHSPLTRIASLTVTILFGSMPLLASEGFSTVKNPWQTTNDAVAKMWQRWQSGTSKPDTRDAKAFAASVLKELNVSAASQTLVFSKTSLQNALINPQTPRSIFFNDECYVGWSQGGMMELIGMDPENGPQFYALTYPQDRNEKPELLTTENCLSCHEGSRTEGVKGLLVRSVYTDESGHPILSEGSFLSGHESPISERWGGWYVTGKHGKERHMGNAIAYLEKGRISLNREEAANAVSLNRFFSTRAYLSDTSDIVALMVLEHQCTMHNKLTDAAKSTREAMARQHDLQKAFREPIADEPQGSALTVINSQAEKVVKHLLFCEEYELKDGGIEGGEAYQDAFRKNRIETKDGRSLKDFQLLTRLFKYRCSFMIYSSGFEALPAPVKKVIYQRLNDILTGRDKGKAFAHLSQTERKHIREILLETKKDLPDYWK